jgi:hypothetical protein
MSELVALLTKATRTKKIQWAADRDCTCFSAALGNGSAELLQHPSGGGFNLVVRSTAGGLLDETGYLSQIASPELAELAREVRGSILNAREGLGKIITGLREMVTES